MASQALSTAISKVQGYLKANNQGLTQMFAEILNDLNQIQMELTTKGTRIKNMTKVRQLVTQLQDLIQEPEEKIEEMSSTDFLKLRMADKPETYGPGAAVLAAGHAGKVVGVKEKNGKVMGYDVDVKGTVKFYMAVSVEKLHEEQSAIDIIRSRIEEGYVGSNEGRPIHVETSEEKMKEHKIPKAGYGESYGSTKTIEHEGHNFNVYHNAGKTLAVSVRAANAKQTPHEKVEAFAKRFEK